MTSNPLQYRLVTYTREEEFFNRLTHGLAALLSVPALVFVVISAARTGDPYRVVSVTIFAASLLLFYSVSALYHTVRTPSVRYIFRILDHAGIYVVIAGTYTPFTLVTLRDGHGWLMFVVVWGLAVAGMIFKTFMAHRLRIIAPLFYIAMGWLVMFDLKELLASLAPGGFHLLLAGGIVYTVGIVFYAVDRIPYNHAIWHLFVIAGSACHYLAIYRFVVPL